MITSEVLTNSSHKWTLRTCDECGRQDDVRMSTIVAGRKRRNSLIDLCKPCANGAKYRVLPVGSSSGHWKHGLTSQGYRRIHVRGDARPHLLEHVHVVEQSLGRSLKKGEVVHHIDGNKINNAASNLHVFDSISDHMRCHRSLRTIGYGLLGSAVWFSRTEFLYVTTPVSHAVPIAPPSLKGSVSISYDNRTGGHYGELCWQEDGIWVKRRHHVVVAETVWNHALLRNEQVHHIDGDSLNNTPSNLCIITSKQHTITHSSLENIVLSFLGTRVTFNTHNGRYELIHSTTTGEL